MVKRYFWLMSHLQYLHPKGTQKKFKSWKLLNFFSKNGPTVPMFTTTEFFSRLQRVLRTYPSVQKKIWKKIFSSNFSPKNTIHGVQIKDILHTVPLIVRFWPKGYRPWLENETGWNIFVFTHQDLYIRCLKIFRLMSPPLSK